MGLISFLLKAVLVFFTWPLILGGVVLYIFFQLGLALCRGLAVLEERSR